MLEAPKTSRKPPQVALSKKKSTGQLKADKRVDVDQRKTNVHVYTDLHLHTNTRVIYFPFWGNISLLIYTLKYLSPTKHQVTISHTSAGVLKFTPYGNSFINLFMLPLMFLPISLVLCPCVSVSSFFHASTLSLFFTFISKYPQLNLFEQCCILFTFFFRFSFSFFTLIFIWLIEPFLASFPLVIFFFLIYSEFIVLFESLFNTVSF